jgi:hypothetical protein
LTAPFQPSYLPFEESQYFTQTFQGSAELHDHGNVFYPINHNPLQQHNATSAYDANLIKPQPGQQLSSASNAMSLFYQCFGPDGLASKHLQ